MKRKIIIILAVVLLMTAFFVGCNVNKQSESEQTLAPIDTTDIKESQKPAATPEPPVNKVTVGLLYSGSDYETEMVKNQVMSMTVISSIQIIVATEEVNLDSPQDSIDSLINEGCKLIFSCAVEQSIVLQAAKQNPDVKFEIYGAMDTGDFKNVSSFYTRLYQQHYLDGMVAGYTSDTGNIAYIAQKADNEDIRRVNAFSLGAKAANKDATVHFVWMDDDIEKVDADSIYQTLLDNNCDVIMRTEINDEFIEFAKANNVSLIGGQLDREDIIPMIRPSLFQYMLDKARDVASNEYENNDIYKGWIGISGYEIDIADYPLISTEELASIQTAMNKMVDGSWDVFSGPIIDTYGNEIIPSGMVIPDEDLFYMFWYVGNIEAISPPMG